MKPIVEQFVEIVNLMPRYVRDYFVAKDEKFQPKTKLAYAGDLQIFFTYLIDSGIDNFNYTAISDIPLEAFDTLSPQDISDFLFYLSDYEFNNHRCSNSPSGKKRKLATIKSFYRYFCSVGKLKNNVPSVIESPKLRNKEIIVLSHSDRDKICKNIESGSSKTKKSMESHEKIKYRDMAILTMFLGTGLRVSELVGINIEDVDWDKQRILITRKGGKTEFIVFGNKVSSTLLDYIDFERNLLLRLSPEECASGEKSGPLFVSLKGDRISARRIEQIIKEYARFVLPPGLKITPHTLRKTFGTELYLKYQDIYLVQNALGHSSPNTTAQYYARFNPDLLEKIKDADI